MNKGINTMSKELKEFKDINDVWKAIDEGKTVYWTNTLYKVYVNSNLKSSQYYNSEVRQYSTRGEKLLSVRCISNYFGSVICAEYLHNLFTVVE